MSEKIEELRKVRIQKLGQLKKQGVDPYPVKTERTHAIAQALELFDHGSRNTDHVTLVGRIRALREHGKLAFINLEDESGAIQLILKEDGLGADQYKNLSLLDIGDFLEATGTLGLSNSGEKSLLTTNYKLLTKSIRPIPSDFFGLKDVETRLRKRYLDLLVNPETKELFRKKAVFWQTIRNFMIKQGFLEVWTPVLENIPGGADAEPFVTHHNKLDRDFYLRISLELPLKRLLVGGFEKVFEVGRLFRNEGIDREHLQEYDDMEFYWAYADYQDGMKLVEKLFKKVVMAVIGSMETEYEGQKINWGGKWQKLQYFTVFKKYTGLDLDKNDEGDLRKKARELGIGGIDKLGKGKLIDAIYKKVVRPKLIQPCFLVGHPIETTPLAKRDPKSSNKVLRFQPLAAGTELGNGFSELNDPLDQKARFEQQMKLREAGDKEAQMMDEDYVEALEYGMPPAVGFGVSERLFAVLMNKAMRETVIFPPMKEG
ncbi:MAG: lysine--tRNA ligase [Candidatus Doudnabacteria bacterium]|nr:lysine--tRNA ligase [Candidatus Doudnabacteria bacterium]